MPDARWRDADTAARGPDARERRDAARITEIKPDHEFDVLSGGGPLWPLYGFSRSYSTAGGARCAGGVQTSAGGRPGLGGRVAVGPDGDAAELAAVRCS